MSESKLIKQYPVTLEIPVEMFSKPKDEYLEVMGNSLLSLYDGAMQLFEQAYDVEHGNKA